MEGLGQSPTSAQHLIQLLAREIWERLEEGGVVALSCHGQARRTKPRTLPQVVPLPLCCNTPGAPSPPSASQHPSRSQTIATPFAYPLLGVQAESQAGGGCFAQLAFMLFSASGSLSFLPSFLSPSPHRSPFKTSSLAESQPEEWTNKFLKFARSLSLPRFLLPAARKTHTGKRGARQVSSSARGVEAREKVE